MNLSDLNSLDLRDISGASPQVRVVILALIFAAVLGVGWAFFWSDALKSLDGARKEEQSLREIFSAKKGQAYHYDAHKRRLAEVEQSLATMLRQLPDRSQMDALLTDINQAGVGRGLEFDLFRPGSETLADFYATLPVAIKVNGGYHDIAGFVSDLAKLPRIVTLHDFSLVPSKEGMLGLDARIQTYRYLDENELAMVRKQKKPGAKK
jgi:type IV pilus assembly protein PilO